MVLAVFSCSSPYVGSGPALFAVGHKLGVQRDQNPHSHISITFNLCGEIIHIMICQHVHVAVDKYEDSDAVELLIADFFKLYTRELLLKI